MTAQPSKPAIASRFGRAADTYDGAAGLQAEVAAALAARLAVLEGRPPVTILEFGCGTGALTRHLARTWPGAHLVATDLSAPMAAACRRLGCGSAHLVMDAERPALAPGSADLVCGSLAAQWFHDCPAALDRLQDLLGPGGVLALATLGPASLAEWRGAQRQAGLSPASLAYPSLDRLRQARRAGLRPLLELSEPRPRRYADAAAFLRALKAIGADAPLAGPNRPGALRRAMRALDAAGPVRITYEIVTLIWQRP